MNRRQILQGSILPLTIPMVGCLTSGDNEADCTDPWTPSVEADEPTLSPGDETTIQIEAKNVSGFYLTEVPPDEADLEIDVARASVSPTPDQTADSYPPQWYWSECTNVEVVIPVRVAEEAEPREHVYTVRLVQSRDGTGDSRERQITITVSDS